MDLLVILLSLNLLAGVYMFCLCRDHLLIIMLSLEFLVLSIFFCLLISMGGVGGFYSLFYLIMTACEGALGLSLLIMMGRSHGGDYLKGVGVMIL